jgi:hypothetical protein
MLATQWHSNVVPFFALVLVLNHGSWAQLKRSYTTPIPKKERTIIIVATVGFIFLMLWQALYMPRAFRRILDDAATSLYLVGALWVLLVGAILCAWFRTQRLKDGDGA